MNSPEKHLKEDTLGNITYIIRFLWQRSPQTIPLSFLAAFCEVLSPFITIFLPKLIIEALQAAQLGLHADPTLADSLIQTILLANFLLLVASVLKNTSRTIIQTQSMENRMNLLIESEAKTVTMDYANFEDPAGQTARQKAYDALGSVAGGAETVVSSLALLIAHLFGLGLYFLVISGLHPGIMLLMIIGSLLNFWALRRAQNFDAAHRDEQAELSKKRSYIHDRASDYQNAKDIRLYDMSAWLSGLMDRFLDQLMNLRRRNLMGYFAADSLDVSIAVLRDGVAYAYLISRVLSRQMTVSDFTLFFAAIAGVSNWMALIADDIHWVLRGSRDIGYVRAYLAIPDKSNRDEGQSLPTNPMPEIDFEHVSFRYPGSESWVLRDFNLKIHGGEKIALVGINGAGKTTCIKLLTGLYQPTEGRILIDGIDIREFNRDEYYRLFSVVFQEVRVLAMDVRRNVALCPNEEIDEAKVLRCLELAGLSEAVAELPQGMKTPLTRAFADDGLDLSGGQAQKLMLARALYKGAPVVVLDEPTAALDPIAEAEQYQRYSEMVGQKTSIYISHRLASTRFCDRIVFIADGRVSELGSHEELMQLNGAYAKMFAVQAHYYQENVKESAGNV